jgi:hypothetical protein
MKQKAPRNIRGAAALAIIGVTGLGFAALASISANFINNC